MRDTSQSVVNQTQQISEQQSDIEIEIEDHNTLSQISTPVEIHPVESEVVDITARRYSEKNERFEWKTIWKKSVYFL